VLKLGRVGAGQDLVLGVTRRSVMALYPPGDKVILTYPSFQTPREGRCEKTKTNLQVA